MGEIASARRGERRPPPRRGLITVLLPMYNEEEGAQDSVNLVIDCLQGIGIQWELIVVDDGSIDRTPIIAARAAEGHENVRVVSHERNLGLGAALRTGVRDSRGEVVLVLDSDLSYGVDCIDGLLEGVKKWDVAVCSPYLCGTRVDGVSPVRILSSKAVNAIYRALFDESIRCFTGMARAYRSQSLRSIQWSSNGFESQAEILVKLALRGSSVGEIPATLKRRTWGRSKFSPGREILPHIRLIFSLVGTMRTDGATQPGPLLRSRPSS